jgi:hypothetical protein
VGGHGQREPGADVLEAAQHGFGDRPDRFAPAELRNPASLVTHMEFARPGREHALRPVEVRSDRLKIGQAQRKFM